MNLISGSFKKSRVGYISDDDYQNTYKDRISGENQANFFNEKSKCTSDKALCTKNVLHFIMAIVTTQNMK